ncbi:MAG TPA: type VI secretion system contractile sheath small subunit [Ignavibacteriaceae bacterium]|nr:type VI secretion system contractile sheath small subunit [Ignavibacteriaceae bacterium]
MARLTTPKIAQRVKVSILPSSDAKESVELDYRLLLPGNFTKSEPGSQGMIKDRRIRTISRKGDFQKVLKDYNPKLNLVVPNKLSDDPEAQMEVKLDFQDIKDFHPDEIVKKVEPLKQLLEARERLKQLKLTVLKDANLKRALENVLKDGSGSIEDLMGKLGTSQEKKETPAG